MMVQASVIVPSPFLNLVPGAFIKPSVPCPMLVVDLLLAKRQRCPANGPPRVRDKAVEGGGSHSIDERHFLQEEEVILFGVTDCHDSAIEVTQCQKDREDGSIHKIFPTPPKPMRDDTTSIRSAIAMHNSTIHF